MLGEADGLHGEEQKGEDERDVRGASVCGAQALTQGT